MKKLLYLFSLFLSICLSACQVDGTEEGGRNEKKDGFTLYYDLSQVVASRSTVPSERGEERINSFYLLFFENTNDGSGQFLHAMDVLDSYDTSLGSTGTLEIDFEAGLNDKDEYKLLLCANTGAYLPGINSLNALKTVCTGKTEQQVISSLQMNIRKEGSGDQLQPLAMSDLPMSGSVVKGPKAGNISVELTRAVSRFDVFCQATGYELVSASIWNAYDRAAVWPDGSNDFSGTVTQRYYGADANANKQIVGTLYAFENYVSRPVQNDNRTTCLIIGLYNNNAGRLEYFRVNVNADHLSQHLKRNNVYRTTIKNVLTAGALTEAAAYGDVSPRLDIDINGWTLNEDDNVVYDDKNILVLPTSLVNMPGAGDSRQYKVFTNGEGTLRMTKEGIPSDITVQLNDHDLYIYAPECTSAWSGTLHFTIGELSASMTLRQQSGPVVHALDLNYDVKGLPEFSGESGVESPRVVVTSSGTWVARIYGGHYMSFSNEQTQIATLRGGPGEGFNIYTIEENTDLDLRHCFAVVTLENDPEVKRAIVLSQLPKEEDPYLHFETTTTVTLTANKTTINNIVLESNVDWTAKFEVSGTSSPKFIQDGVEVSTISGSGTTTISIVIPANTVYSKNTITLKATADEFGLTTSRKFEQAAKVDDGYIRFNPSADVDVSTAGATYTNIKVESNYSWEATLQVITGSASPYMTENNKQVVKVTGTGNKTLTITFPPNYKASTSTVYLTAKTTNAPTTRTANKVFRQSAYDRSSPRVISNGAGVGNLVSTSSTNYTDYVYALGTKMRNPKTVGVSTAGKFSFSSGISESNIHKAQIIQLVSGPTQAEFDMIYKAMQEDKLKFLMITGNLNSTVRPTIEMFEKKVKAGYGTVYEVNLSAHTARYFNSGSSKLIKYLIDGPAGKSNAVNLLGYSYSVGFAHNNYPSTFIPIIRSTVSGSVVFGIDPTHRLIFIGDPGIFGSNRTNNSNYPNWQNYYYATSGNSIFLDNLVAWMISAVTVEGFADTYK